MNFVGGECKNVSILLFRGYSDKVPIATGKSRSYLDAISGSMQIPIEGRSLLAIFQAKPTCLKKSKRQETATENQMRATAETMRTETFHDKTRRTATLWDDSRRMKNPK